MAPITARERGVLLICMGLQRAWEVGMEMEMEIQLLLASVNTLHCAALVRLSRSEHAMLLIICIRNLIQLSNVNGLPARRGTAAVRSVVVNYI